MLTVAFMAVKCGEEEIPRPSSLDPITVTLAQALTNDSLLDLTIKISDSVFFIDPDSTQFNGSGSNGGGSREINNCDGLGGLVVFTSTDREFAYEYIPTGMGPIYGILSEYQGTRQLLMRDIEDVAEMTGKKCNGGSGSSGCQDLANNIYLNKDFEDENINGCNWVTFNVVGSTNWETSFFGGTNFAKITNWNGSANTAAESWLISPAVDLSSSTTPKLSFTNVANYNGPGLEVLVSTNYSGSGDPSSATWTDISAQATLDTDLSQWNNFGDYNSNIDLTVYKSATTYVAFKYVGTDSDGSTQEIDDIIIKE